MSELGMGQSFTIRHARDDDREAIRRLDNLFEFPWRVAEIWDLILDPTNEWGAGCRVADQHGVIGFAAYQITDPALLLISFIVAPECRRQGVGYWLLKDIQATADREQLPVTAMVRETNLPAHKCLRRAGFKALSVARGYYNTSDEDAFEFVYSAAKQ